MFDVSINRSILMAIVFLKIQIRKIKFNIGTAYFTGNKLNKSESLCILAINLILTITVKLLYNITLV